MIAFRVTGWLEFAFNVICVRNLLLASDEKTIISLGLGRGLNVLIDVMVACLFGTILILIDLTKF